MRGFSVSLGNTSSFIDPCCWKLRALREDLPVAISSLVPFPPLLRFAEGVSPVGDRTAVGHLEVLVRVVGVAH